MVWLLGFVCLCCLVCCLACWCEVVLAVFWLCWLFGVCVLVCTCLFGFGCVLSASLFCVFFVVVSHLVGLILFLICCNSSYLIFLCVCNTIIPWHDFGLYVCCLIMALLVILFCGLVMFDAWLVILCLWYCPYLVDFSVVAVLIVLVWFVDLFCNLFIWVFALLEWFLTFGLIDLVFVYFVG